MKTNLKICDVCKFSAYDLFQFNSHLGTHAPPPEENNVQEGEAVDDDDELMDVVDAEVPEGEVKDDKPAEQPSAPSEAPSSAPLLTPPPANNMVEFISAAPTPQTAPQ